MSSILCSLFWRIKYTPPQKSSSLYTPFSAIYLLNQEVQYSYFVLTNNLYNYKFSLIQGIMTKFQKIKQDIEIRRK